MNKKADFSYESQMRLFFRLVAIAGLLGFGLGGVSFYIYHHLDEKEKKEFLEKIKVVEPPKENRYDYGYGDSNYSQAPWGSNSFESDDGEEIILDNPVEEGSAAQPDIPEEY